MGTSESSPCSAGGCCRDSMEVELPGGAKKLQCDSLQRARSRRPLPTTQSRAQSRRETSVSREGHEPTH